MVDVLEAAGEIALAPPRSPSRLGRVALLLALLPGLGLALNAASPPGWGSSLGTLYALLIAIPPIPAFVTGLVGLFRDERKWLAGAAVGLALLPFAFLGYLAACS